MSDTIPHHPNNSWIVTQYPRVKNWKLFVHVVFSGSHNFYLSVLLLMIQISQSQSEKLICYCKMGYCCVEFFYYQFLSSYMCPISGPCRYRPTLEPVHDFAIVDTKYFVKLALLNRMPLTFNITIISPYYLLDCHPL